MRESDVLLFFSMTISLKRGIINIRYISFLQIAPVYMQDTRALCAQEDIRYLKHLSFVKKFSASLEYLILLASFFSANIFNI